MRRLDSTNRGAGKPPRAQLDVSSWFLRMAGGHTREYRAPRVPLHISHRLDGSRSDFVRAGRDGGDAGPAPVGPDAAACARLGSLGPAPAVVWSRLSGDDRVRRASFLCRAGASVSE